MHILFHIYMEQSPREAMCWAIKCLTTFQEQLNFARYVVWPLKQLVVFLESKIIKYIAKALKFGNKQYFEKA